MSVCWLVGWSVCHNFLRKREVSIPCSYRSPSSFLLSAAPFDFFFHKNSTSTSASCHIILLRLNGGVKWREKGGRVEGGVGGKSGRAGNAIKITWHLLLYSFPSPRPSFIFPSSPLPRLILPLLRFDLSLSSF